MFILCKSWSVYFSEYILYFYKKIFTLLLKIDSSSSSSFYSPFPPKCLLSIAHTLKKWELEMMLVFKEKQHIRKSVEILNSGKWVFLCLSFPWVLAVELVLWRGIQVDCESISPWSFLSVCNFGCPPDPDFLVACVYVTVEEGWVCYGVLPWRWPALPLLTVLLFSCRPRGEGAVPALCR